ncbi:hypothetical protein [Streptomyces sp. NPDC018056]|uniref:hypothetical protein n=1 Tax=Streptomyces sp. NPDC018056 TaxID=3365039 RepID=UPI0037A47C15
MGGHTVRTAVTLGAAVVLSAALGTVSAASAAPAAPTAAGHTWHRQPVFVDCLWKPRTRPEAFILACGDGNSRLSSLRWTRWDGRAAVARGVNVVNDCKPYCAAGTFHSYPVVVRLDRAEPWKKHPRVQHFTQLTLVFPGARPAGYERTVTYPLWN